MLNQLIRVTRRTRRILMIDGWSLVTSLFVRSEVPALIAIHAVVVFARRFTQTPTSGLVKKSLGRTLWPLRSLPLLLYRA